MISELHFLRPWCFLLTIPLLAILSLLAKKKAKLSAWESICDNHLMPYLVQKKDSHPRLASLVLLFFSILLMIISLMGPTWEKLPVPIYKQIQPRVLVLDMSANMMAADLTPNRLSRAKFKLHDLFLRKDVGQIGLVVFTGEPFVVSPLTEDGQTISSLLSVLTPEIMPVEGYNLAEALVEAGRLITHAGFNQGQILVLTATPPSTEAVDEARMLAKESINTSIMPVKLDNNDNSMFQRFAGAGNGEMIKYQTNTSDLDQWLSLRNQIQFSRDQDDIPLWRDQGRWFLIPALLLLLPIFRKGWLQRIAE